MTGSAPNHSSYIARLTPKEMAVLVAKFDTDKNGHLSPEELNEIFKDYGSKKITDPEVLNILKRFDVNGDGTLDENEAIEFKHQVDINETSVRYAGYTAGIARLFRYLAFTSDFGEALRPVVHERVVKSMYAVSIGYCFADVGWEAYKLKQRGYVTEHNVPMTMSQLVVERSTFQAIASMAVPTLVIHSSVSAARKFTTKIGRFQKWGPSVVGLSIIPLLPMYLDHPVGKM
jgi:mitochondrial fission process protein 1